MNTTAIFARKGENKTYNLAEVKADANEITLKDAVTGTTLKLAVQSFANNFTRTVTKGEKAPRCVFCDATGSGVQFSIFTPRFKPFGTACVACEASLPK